MKTGRLWTWLVLVMLMITAVACRSAAVQAPASVLTLEEATALAENAMSGFAAGDYATWSRDWSGAMKGAISEDAFLIYRQEVIGEMGAYKSIESVAMAPSQTEGYVRWIVVTNFEKGQIEFAFSFRQDSNLIEGIFPRQLG